LGNACLNLGLLGIDKIVYFMVLFFNDNSKARLVTMICSSRVAYYYY